MYRNVSARGIGRQYHEQKLMMDKVNEKQEVCIPMCVCIYIYKCLPLSFSIYLSLSMYVCVCVCSFVEYTGSVEEMYPHQNYDELVTLQLVCLHVRAFVVFARLDADVCGCVCVVGLRAHNACRSRTVQG